MKNERDLLREALTRLEDNHVAPSLQKDIRAALAQQVPTWVAYAVAYPDGRPVFYAKGCILWPTREGAVEASKLTLGAGEPVAICPQPAASALLVQEVDYAIEHGWPPESREALARIRAADIRRGATRTTEPAQPAVQAGTGDVLVPRDLIGAACGAIAAAQGGK